ncbi:PH domain-containing protein [Oerskovia flava]|uniref:PH domain-containing protein n=1 Tax=Oerskovia flava TaxID=2986422 RepID=UPI00223FFDFC|nr:PH domain-containing protein [Oerskovia sp. JB1-3-2]
MQPSLKVSSRILDRYILIDERIVVAARHHWGKLIEPIATVVVSAILLALLAGALAPAMGAGAQMVWWLWVPVLARTGWKLLEWRNEWFVTTNRRMILTYGLITHKVAMMPLGKVTDMNYSRSILGRVLGYGQFILESAGQDQAMRQIDWVKNPDVTYRQICDTLFGPSGHDPDDDRPDGEDEDEAPPPPLWPGESPAPVPPPPPFSPVPAPPAGSSMWSAPPVPPPPHRAGEGPHRTPEQQTQPLRVVPREDLDEVDRGWEISAEDRATFVSLHPPRDAAPPRDLPPTIPPPPPPAR